METSTAWPDRKLMALLRRLALRAGTRAQSAMPAGRKSRELGVSMEIADFRAYTQGDDPRHLDWGQLAKFDQLVVRLFYAQRALRVALVLDCSASMNFGTPGKFNYARSLAACLGMIALNGRHECDLFPSHHAGMRNRPEHYAGAGAAVMAALIGQLKALAPEGTMNITAQLRQAARRRCDVLMLISDCLPPRDLSSAFNTVMSTGSQLVVLHVLCPAEVVPDWEGVQVLRDVESGRVRRIASGVQARKAYEHSMKQWKEQLERSVRRGGGQYIDILTSDEIESVLARHLAGVAEA
jgi:uncharacterized protein (DUF58 family)